MRGPLINKKTFAARIWENKIMWLMLMPGIAFIIIFAYIPMGGIIIAFKEYKNQLGVWGSPWVGFGNFRYLFISGKLWQLLRNTLSYNAAFIATGMICEVAFAVIISELPFRSLKKLFQSFTFLPFFISWVVVAAIMMNIFGYETGVLNGILSSLGMERVNIYGSPAKFPLVLVLLRLWKSVGYGCVIYLASITGMDQEILEAAEIDGANIWQRIWHITLAWIRPTMVILLLLAIGSVFRGDFGMFYQITGRSQQLLEVSDILDTYVYRSLMNSPNIGMSAAAGLFQSILCFVSILLANYLVKRIEPDYTLF